MTMRDDFNAWYFGEDRPYMQGQNSYHAWIIWQAALSQPSAVDADWIEFGNYCAEAGHHIGYDNFNVEIALKQFRLDRAPPRTQAQGEEK